MAELCWECKKVEIPEPEMCCSGHMCGCYGLPVEPPYCDECHEKLLGGREEVPSESTKHRMTWSEFKDTRRLHTLGGQLFIDTNRFGRIFIKAISEARGYKTFNFTARGYGHALEWIKEASGV